MARKRVSPKDSFLDKLESDEEQPISEEGWYQQQIRHLQQQIGHLKQELMQTHRRNRQLTNVLQEAKEKLEVLKEKVEQLSAPPNNYGVFLGLNDDGTVDIDVNGRKWRVNLDPDIKPKSLVVGQQVIVNSGMNVVGIRDAEKHGDVVKVKERLSDERAPRQFPYR